MNNLRQRFQDEAELELLDAADSLKRSAQRYVDAYEVLDSLGGEGAPPLPSDALSIELVQAIIGSVAAMPEATPPLDQVDEEEMEGEEGMEDEEAEPAMDEAPYEGDYLVSVTDEETASESVFDLEDVSAERTPTIAQEVIDVLKPFGKEVSWIDVAVVSIVNELNRHATQRAIIEIALSRGIESIPERIRHRIRKWQQRGAIVKIDTSNLRTNYFVLRGREDEHQRKADSMYDLYSIPG